ncbi:hypothetical protein ACEWY4_016663 [Coilia grayii]|uniref:DDE Tnp4 domain-containing protein n=1 Tax=Coilia grayii TaxID=363190 RepID=A0ABD1JME9_9TELE
MPVPDAAEWRRIAADFNNLAFPNCLGAMDGKHVVIEAPPRSGSLYYNYKGTFSIVLLAVVDAKYRFRLVDVGAYGKNSDGGTLAASAFGAALRRGSLDIPEDSPLPGAEHLGAMPFVFVADEAFPLRKNIMCPYPGHTAGEKRAFNFRLSHVRRIVECAFGILATQWRVYRRVLCVSPEVAESIVKATCILQNFMRWDNDTIPRPAPTAEPSFGLLSTPRLGSNNATRDAVAVREAFAAYFSSPAGRALESYSSLRNVPSILLGDPHLPPPSVEPSMGAIVPGASQTFSVEFCPIEQHSMPRLKGEQCPATQLRDASLVPVCLFHQEDSGYITSIKFIDQVQCKLAFYKYPLPGGHPAKAPPTGLSAPPAEGGEFGDAAGEQRPSHDL